MEEVRLLPLEVADGPHQMAADEALVEAAVAGQAGLRFYRWSEATVSLGYFQQAASRLGEPLLAPLPFVRRPSGGQTLVHPFEVTYALALPERLLLPAPPSWLRRMHDIIAAAFVSLDVVLEPAKVEQRDPGTILCFRQIVPGDLRCRGAKVVGSAQRKHRKCLLQHGGILLAQSPHTPRLPGIREQLGRDIAPAEARSAIVRDFARVTGWQVVEQAWTGADREAINRLVRTKYATAGWNDKR